VLAVHQIPFGLQGTRCIHISELSKHNSGLKCGCVCPACGYQLVARMGDKNRHHFAHYRDSDCSKAAETGIHLRAKEVIQVRKTFFLPEKVVSVTRRHQHNKVAASSLLVNGGTPVHFERVDVEKPEKGFQPDLTGHTRGRKLFIEIRVTHAVDKEKQAKIEASATSCVEINLSGIDRFATPSQIEAAIDDTNNSSWMYHALEQRTLKTLHDELEPGYQALVTKHNEEVTREQREQERKDKFKSALKEVGRLLTNRLLNYDIIPEHLSPNGPCHLSFNSYDDASNAGVIDCHVAKQGSREMVSIVWSYKKTSHHILRKARRLNIPFCLIDISPLIVQHKPPHKPIQECSLAWISHSTSASTALRL